MAKDWGKVFEERFKKDIETTFDKKAYIFRLKDQMSGYKEVSRNPCDFFVFNGDVGKLHLIECKEHKGNTFPIVSKDSNTGELKPFRQYDLLLESNKYENVYPAVVLWFIDHSKVLYIPITEIKKMIDDGCKSVNVKMLEENTYSIIEVPIIKSRILNGVNFINNDYSFLKGIKKND